MDPEIILAIGREGRIRQSLGSQRFEDAKGANQSAALPGFMIGSPETAGDGEPPRNFDGEQEWARRPGKVT
jgi:hypothetical protein